MQIYLISGSENGPVKIGYSKNPEIRLKQLQTANSSNLNIYYQTNLDNINIPKLEKLIHKDINYLRAKGEWFNITPKMATSIIEHAIIRYSEDIEEKLND